jgi:signal transduction histidine kinase
LIAKRPEHADKLGSVFDTIEERADHLKTFLDGYAGLARLPAPRPAAVAWQPFLDHLRALYPSVVLPSPPERAGFFDPVQIEQVLINLIKNAVEAGSPPDAVEIALQLEDDGAVRFEISDRGSGFDDEALQSAFTPFYTTKEKGSGMGHSLCREIVEAHGGRLSLGNRDGGGALVTLLLPGRAPADSRLSRSRAKLTLSRI